jgi:hypothetical protein
MIRIFLFRMGIPGLLSLLCNKLVDREHSGLARENFSCSDLLVLRPSQNEVNHIPRWTRTSALLTCLHRFYNYLLVRLQIQIFGWYHDQSRS